MTGVVFCGGQSLRMGTDKGLLSSGPGNWTQTAIDKLASLDIPVTLSISETQYPEYNARFQHHSLIIDNPSLIIKGPVAGLLSVHLQFPNDDLIVLACDMPLMKISLLKELIAQYDQVDADAFVFRHQQEVEPLCGIYTSAGLSTILNRYHSNQLHRHSMKYVLDLLNTFCLPLSDEQKTFFSNINTPDELNML